MELKELTLKICDIFGCSSITTLPDKVMFALFSQNPTLYLEPHNNQKQSEISEYKSLITSIF